MAAMEVVLGLLIGGLLFILYLLYRFAYAPFHVLKNCGIKGPTPVPFFGDYKNKVKMSALEYDKHLSSKYGTVCGFYIGQRPHILISDLDMVKQILVKDFDHAPFPILLTDDSESKNLLASRGDMWMAARRIITPSLSASKMKMMLPLLKKSVDNLLVVVGDKATSEKSFDVLNLYSSYTLEIILAAAFGRLVDVQKGESEELSRCVDTLLEGVMDGQIERYIMFYSHFPWLVKILRYIFSFTEAGKALSNLRNVALRLIKARREVEETGTHKDLLQQMIEATGEEGEDVAEEKGSAECPVNKKNRVMSDADVLANCVGIILSGHETTSTTLSFASYLLALHPVIQEKLQSEIDTYFDNNPESTLYTAAQEIVYLDQVVQETLRLYPPAPQADRYSNKTTVVNGVTIPKGVVVVVPICVIHHSPLYWKDPEEFDPDRFTPEERAKRPQLSHMPFGFGPRNCIGMRLALLEAKVALIEVLKSYTFVRAPETEVPLQIAFGITMRPKNGIYLKVINRS